MTNFSNELADAGDKALLVELLNMLVERGVLNGEDVQELTKRAAANRDRYMRLSDKGPDDI